MHANVQAHGSTCPVCCTHLHGAVVCLRCGHHRHRGGPRRLSAREPARTLKDGLVPLVMLVLGLLIWTALAPLEADRTPLLPQLLELGLGLLVTLPAAAATGRLLGVSFGPLHLATLKLAGLGAAIGAAGCAARAWGGVPAELVTSYACFFLGVTWLFDEVGAWEAIVLSVVNLITTALYLVMAARVLACLGPL